MFGLTQPARMVAKEKVSLLCHSVCVCAFTFRFRHQGLGLLEFLPPVYFRAYKNDCITSVSVVLSLAPSLHVSFSHRKFRSG